MSSNKRKKMKSSTETGNELEQVAVVSREDNNDNAEDESNVHTAVELEHLGLDARIRRLERIFDTVKAARFCASSRTNLDT
ncbi:hypothetical protein AgCh_028345 [Apium graveolens]